MELPSEEEMKERAGRGEPFRVLDLGTGTGIWAIDFGDMYPSAEVLGIDISPIQVCSLLHPTLCTSYACNTVHLLLLVWSRRYDGELGTNCDGDYSPIGSRQM